MSHENTVVDTAAVYFATVHTWLPFISRKRMDLGIPLQNGGPDLAMLFFAMKLVTTPAARAPSAASNNPLYVTSKAFMAMFEADGAVSLLCLQSMILIALYEYGHAVYPAAWMTVGACARYAGVLGIALGDESASVMDQVASDPHCPFLWPARSCQLAPIANLTENRRRGQSLKSATAYAGRSLCWIGPLP